MGRWGYTLFQGDSDLDIVSEFEDAVGISLFDEPVRFEEAREKLDAGLGAELFSKYRAKEQTGTGFLTFSDPSAAISPDDREHLKEIFPQVPSKNGYVSPLGDDGFRDPGQVQYRAALDNYVDGEPRNFFEPSCFNCGKIEQNISPAKLKRCVACEKGMKSAPYYNKECQKENWRKHKAICGRPQGNGAFQMLNV